MLTFGAVSSVFDVVTFAALWWGFGGADHETLFRTGWFLEGLLSQLLIVQVLRSGTVPWRPPRLAAVLVLSASLVALVGCVLPLKSPGGCVAAGTDAGWLCVVPRRRADWVWRRGGRGQAVVRTTADTGPAVNTADHSMIIWLAS
jgi:hypothetical protein